MRPPAHSLPIGSAPAVAPRSRDRESVVKTAAPTHDRRAEPGFTGAGGASRRGEDCRAWPHSRRATGLLLTALAVVASGASAAQVASEPAAGPVTTVRAVVIGPDGNPASGIPAALEIHAGRQFVHQREAVTNTEGSVEWSDVPATAGNRARVGADLGDIRYHQRVDGVDGRRAGRALLSACCDPSPRADRCTSIAC